MTKERKRLQDLTQTNSKERGLSDIRYVTWVGMIGNLLLALVKFIFGMIGKSQAVVADAVHSLSDLSTDLAILIGSHYWSQPADENHPHGHGRIETVITVFLGVFLASVGIGIGWEAIRSLQKTENGISIPSLVAFWAAVFSILTKEILFQWTVRIGRRVKSKAVVANAWHHRSDVFSSLPAAISVAVAAWKPQWAFVDRIGALIVCIFILQTSWSILSPALMELIDTAAARHDIQKIKDMVIKVPGVRSVHAIRTRSIGSGIALDLHVLVDGDLTVREGHNIARQVKLRLLREGPDVEDVIVHIEPYGEEESYEDEK